MSRRAFSSADAAILSIRAEKWVQNGYALGHDPEGEPIFIHGALPNEAVDLQRVARRETHSFGIALTGSAWSGYSECPAFPLCGGCSFRHLPYEEEREIKLRLLRELKPIDQLLNGEVRYHGSPRDGYRNHIRIQSQEGRSGFYKILSHEVIPFNGCRNLSPALNEAVLNYPGYPESGESRFRETAERIYNPVDLARYPCIAEIVAGRRWLFPSGGFFQSNRFLIEPWLNELASMIENEGSSAVELFCGSGLIGGAVRSRVGNYTGIESDRNAIEAARRNFSDHGFEGRFICADLYREPPDLQGAETVIVNPPRSGLNRPLMERIAESAREIIYSSCNPHTLNRDLAHLMKRGYHPDRCAIFDFFPATPHLEMAVRLRR